MTSQPSRSFKNQSAVFRFLLAPRENNLLNCWGNGKVQPLKNAERFTGQRRGGESVGVRSRKIGRRDGKLKDCQRAISLPAFLSGVGMRLAFGARGTRRNGL